MKRLFVLMIVLLSLLQVASSCDGRIAGEVTKKHIDEHGYHVELDGDRVWKVIGGVYYAVEVTEVCVFERAQFIGNLIDVECKDTGGGD